MKKYLLSSFLSLIAFVGFTNAVSYTFDYTLDGAYGWFEGYTPYSFVLSNDSILSSVSYNSEIDDDCQFWVCPLWTSASDCQSMSSSDMYCYIDSYDSSNSCSDKFFSAWTYYITQAWGSPFTTITFNFSSSDSWDSWNWGLIENWTWTFSWIITSLWTTVSEFIPYVVYLWVWILGALIWFVAVKRLMNRIRRKVFWTFSNWRRR